MKKLIFVLATITPLIKASDSSREERKSSPKTQDESKLEEYEEISSDEVNLLIEKFKTLNYKETYQASIRLAEAIWKNNTEEKILEEVKTEVNKGANVNLVSQQHDGLLPLQSAMLLCYPKVVKFLLENGSDLYAIDSWGNTPIRTATNLNNPEILAIIKEALDK